MPADFKHNHYVPEWYQKRFMRPDQGKYFYLDLKPEQVVRDGHRFTRGDLLKWGPSSCFAEDDLYTVKWGGKDNVDIEKFFFGRVDSNGKAAVEFFGDFRFDHERQREAFYDLMNYMSVQKLRTPKGLGVLSSMPGGKDHTSRLMLLQSIQDMYCAIWSECIWLIADATRSATKFIISDHPVTVYNRRCFPGSDYCKGFNDPDIRMVGTHTYFPLSHDKVLILTNLSWVRNPYQDERKFRPNSRYFRQTIFKFTDIQIFRSLSEQEVLEINYITKRRAFRFVAASEREWLYPEKHLPSTHWSKFGDGLLLMPEPRDIHMGGEILVGYNDGRSAAWNEYGHDDLPRETVARYLESLNFQAVILNEQASQNRTVIEKIEAHSDVGFAVVLLTPDDEGGKKGTAPQPRARQNVLLELGYFMGKLSRDRVCAIMRGKVEVPTDFAGVVWVPYDDAGAWKTALAKELQVHFDIDWNVVMRR